MRTLTIVGSTALMMWLVASGISLAASHSWTTTTGDVRVVCPLTVGGSFEPERRHSRAGSPSTLQRQCSPASSRSI